MEATVCDYISAYIAYHKYIKMTQYNDRGQLNFNRFDDINKWFVEKDIDQVWKNTWEWLDCNTKDARNSHVHNILIR